MNITINEPPSEADSSHEYGNTPGAPGLKEETPAPSHKRNQFLKVDEPKNKQFTGRATTKEYERIEAALAARKQPGQSYDIVRFALDMMDYLEDDILQTFKTK